MKECKKDKCDFFDESIDGCERPDGFKICSESVVEKVADSKVKDVKIEDVVSDSDDE